MKPSPLLPLLLLLAGPAVAQSVVFRCPGPPERFTNMLSAEEAKAQGCRTIEGAPISVVSTPKRPPAVAASAQRPEGAKDRVEPGQQKVRDDDRRVVLETELRQAEARLAELRKEYADGQPERRGDERNYAKYQERVAELKSALTRQEADVQALKRELAKIGGR